MKFGTVAIIGRSNVGKSTLLNCLLGEKISIVSSKPQTTRTRIMGVVHVEGAQIAFLDTPGLHKPEHLLNRRMLRTAVETLEDADLLYMLMDATSLPGPGDLAAVKHMKEALAKRLRPVILVVTKIDLVNKKQKLLPTLEQYGRLFAWTEIVPVSAQVDDNVDRLLAVTVPYLPSAEGAYGDDVVTDQTMRTLAAEMIREKVLQETEEEVPYAVAVEIDEFVEQGKLAKIRASILVERETQKGILIGKQGERLKSIGTQARLDMERLFGMKVFLELWVKVRKAWREDEQTLVQLGY
jgi:GTP-binding protein Era